MIPNFMVEEELQRVPHYLSILEHALESEQCVRLIFSEIIISVIIDYISFLEELEKIFPQCALSELTNTPPTTITTTTNNNNNRERNEFDQLKTASEYVKYYIKRAKKTNWSDPLFLQRLGYAIRLLEGEKYTQLLSYLKLSDIYDILEVVKTMV